MRLPNSFAGLDGTANGLENGFNLNFQHRGMGAVSTTVSGYHVGGAENNVLAIRRLNHGRKAASAAIRAVSRGIRRAEEGDDWRAQCNCEVKRAGVSAYNANGGPQKGHQRTEFTVEQNGINVAACGAKPVPLMNFTSRVFAL